MCSRYELNAPPREVALRFALDAVPPAVNAPEVRPTDQGLIIDGSAGARLLAWGLEANWDNKPLINARAETLSEKKTFQPLLGRRCLVPASGYFEWRKDGGAKLRNHIAPLDNAPFAMAGLFDDTRFTIVTCAPSPAIAHIHNRMPVILAPALEAAWLDPQVPFADVASALVPYDHGRLAAEEDTPPPPRQPDLFG